jgi:hypothetical protein
MAPARPSQAEPVRFYADDDARLPVRLSKILQDRIDGLSESVLSGQLSKKDYRFSTGQITAFKEALSECQRIGKELNGD